ncbi:glycosyltransferase family 2 protein [Halomonas alkalisoli]|uniref:glycosyltransferase family 2 protein n=1 Tax=Halomonas alkalisoli TaxID=2907158 RepID=UPI001F43FE1D|nr:glycosyltransferase [Halomonas alkalisoli]MCE9683141.1 glycosyltransferase [Halomonas alkalisoli]
MPDLRTEDQIIESWQGDVSQPLVSICCSTFNHEPYIRDALNGFLIQETVFPFEILIHDDASTDDTANIILDYYKKYPRLIKPILQTVNQFSQGVRPARINHQRALGKYLAICEGDDYWTCGAKLQLQFDALEKNVSSDMCFHPAVKIDYLTGGESIIGKYAPQGDKVIPVEEVIIKKHGLIPTASIMIRHHIHEEIHLFRESRPHLTVGDIYLFFFGAKRGGAIFIDNTMSVYRANLPGSWTAKNKGDYKARMHNIHVRVKSYTELDNMTGFTYSRVFMHENDKRLLGIFKEKAIPAVEKISYYKKNYRYMTIKGRSLALPFILISSFLYFTDTSKHG